MAASLGGDPIGLGEACLARFARGHDAALMFFDGPKEAGLGRVEAARAQMGYHTEEGAIHTCMHGDRCARTCSLLVAWKEHVDWGRRLLEQPQSRSRTHPLPL